MCANHFKNDVDVYDKMFNIEVKFPDMRVQVYSPLITQSIETV